MSNAAGEALVARSRPPTLGLGADLRGRTGGVGNTTLAEEVASLSGAPVIHMDDLFEGWKGLSRVSDQLDTPPTPLAEGGWS